MIKSGAITAPSFLQHPFELRQKGVDMPWREMLEKQQGIHLERKSIGKSAEMNESQTVMTATAYKVLLILVRFSDKDSSVGATSFDQIAFGTTSNTLRTYYQAVSRGTLDIVTVNLPSSLGWQQMPQSYSYYVNGQYGLGDPTYPYSYPNNAQKLAEDAVDAVDDFVNFSQYDNDGDGYVDALMIAHTGPGAEFTGSPNDIWSHSWQMSSPKLHDSVYTYAYTMQPEYWQSAGDMTCGVYAHEFGHMVFDLPDLYDTDYSSQGLGNWSLMAAGSWNGLNGMGGSPAFPDAWCRISMGFASVINITSNISSQQIENVQASSIVFRLWKYGATGAQYFLVENRQQSGYDTYLPGSGLLIYHVDDNVDNRNANVNEWYPGHTSSGHYKVALEQADNSFHLEKNQNRGDTGDPYPGTSNNRSFSLSSSPNSNDYSGNNTYVSILNISNSSSTMTADLQIGSVSVVIDQMLSDNTTRVGTIGRWSGSSFPNPRLNPGDQITVTQGSTEVLQGDQQILYGEKFNNWNNDADVTNHHIFVIPSDMTQLTSNFIPAHDATIKFEEGISGGTGLEFKDPWLIDYTDPLYGNNLRNQGMSAPFKSVASGTGNLGFGTIYKGVFLNQDFADPNKPYYTVRAPSNPIPGFLWTFIDWKGENAVFQNPKSRETPVVFTDADAIVTARWKAHMAASSPVSHSNQRKIVKMDNWDNCYDMVHESSGEIFHSFSTDGGITWSLEEWPGGLIVSTEYLLSDSTGNSSNPSITHIHMPPIEYHKVIVVWEEKINNGNGYRIMMRKGDWSWGGEIPTVYFNPSSIVYENTATRPPAATPMISHHTACWKDPAGIMCAEVFGGTQYVVSGTDANSVHPAIGGSFDPGGNIVWQQNSVGILYKNDSEDATPPITIAGNSASVTNVSPTIGEYTYSATYVYVAWEERDVSVSQSSLKFRSIRYDGTLSPVSTIYTCPLTDAELSPTLNYYANGSDITISVVWSISGGGVGCAINKNGIWSDPFMLPKSGQYVSIGRNDCDYGTSQPLVVSKSSAGPPYRLQIDYVPLTSSSQTVLSLSAGNNLVSVPLLQLDYTTSVLFPGVSGGVVYGFSPGSGYWPVSTMQMGMGYWAYYTNATDITITGMAPGSITVPCTLGWNIIGSRNVPVQIANLQVSNNNSIMGGVGYFVVPGSGYVPVTQIQPGQGVWIYLIGPSADCTVTIP